MVNIAKIEVLIKAKGWSNSYFCSLFNKNRGWIRDWKRGKGLPDENTLCAIADKLDTTVDYLTDKTDKKEKLAAENGKPTDLQRLLESQKSLMFNGMPLSDEDREKLLTAMRIAMEIDNKHKK